MYLSASAGSVDCISVLVCDGADVHWNSDIALRVASRRGDIRCVKQLLGFGSDPSASDYQPLRTAAVFGHLDVCRLLCSHVDNDTVINSCLVDAGSNGHTDVVMFLIERGADVHYNNDQCLRWSCRNGHIDTVLMLCDHGADVHAEDDEALRWSALHGNAGVVEVLLSHGARPGARNNEAMRMSVAYDHSRCITLLAKAGATLDGFPRSSLMNRRFENMDIRRVVSPR